MKNDHRANGKNEAFVNPHHLPEAVAISDLSRGSVKFNPISAIKSFLSKVPELRDAIDNGGDTNVSSLEIPQGSESL